MIPDLTEQDPGRMPRGTARRSLRRSVDVAAIAVVVAAALIGGAGGAGAARLLTGKDVANNSLRSADFRASSIGAVKFHAGTLTQADVGFDIAGEQGGPGIPGSTGFAGIRSIHMVGGAPVSSDGGQFLTAPASCDTGEISLSGGAELLSAGQDARPSILYSHRVGTSGWITSISTSLAQVVYKPWVVCARVP